MRGLGLGKSFGTPYKLALGLIVKARPLNIRTRKSGPYRN